VLNILPAIEKTFLPVKKPVSFYQKKAFISGIGITLSCF
jgi:hypothetical protein